MRALEELRVKIFADGADKAGMLEMYRKSYISGLTTNPTLMRKAGVSDYRSFGREAAAAMPDKPISFEVFSDEFPEMERQATEIAGWGGKVYVKIPITNTKGESSVPLVRRLAGRGVRINVTALMTLDQVREVSDALDGDAKCFVSVFAGRIADTGRDPLPMMVEALRLLERLPGVELIWASPRELFNIVQADEIGCHIITATYDILKKIPLMGKRLEEYSLDTVKMFYDDAASAGFRL
jgi:transaldolase